MPTLLAQENVVNKLISQANKFSDASKRLFGSLSIDDIAIRKFTELTTSRQIVGYPDIGKIASAEMVDLGGGPTSTPATHAMVLMFTAINDSFKVPIAYFIINEKFTGKGNIHMGNNLIYQ